MKQKIKSWAIWSMMLFSLCLICIIPAHTAMAALTKTETTESLAWTLLTDTGDAAGIKETGSIDVSDSYDTVLHIDVCAGEAAAHDGTEVIVQVASEAGEDGSWTTLRRYIALAGITSVKADCNAVNSTNTVYVTDPAGAGLDHDGKVVFIYDTGTIGNSQIMYQIDNSGDAGDTITVIDPPDHATDTDCDVLSCDVAGDAGGLAEAVSTVPVSIPLSASQARVIFNNWYGAGTDANVVVRVRVTKVTAL